MHRNLGHLESKQTLASSSSPGIARLERQETSLRQAASCIDQQAVCLSQSFRAVPCRSTVRVLSRCAPYDGGSLSYSGGKGPALFILMASGSGPGTQSSYL